MDKNNNNLRELEKLAKNFNVENIVTQEVVEEMLKGVLSIMVSFKKDNQTMNAETKRITENLLAQIETKYNKLLKETENTENRLEEDFATKVKKMEALIEEMKLVKPKDGEKGEDADEELIVEKVLAQIKLPETEILTGEDIANRLESLEGDARLDASAIKNLPEFKQNVINGGGWRNLYQMHDVEISAPTDNQVLTYDGTTNTWKNENATSGTIDGSGTANELTYWVDSDTVGALAVATYPSLTEISYIKGLTSAIQTQLNAKQASDTQLTSLAGLSYTGNGGKFIRVNAGETDFELATISAGGNVSKVGTPVDNQIGVWTGDGTIEGTTGLTYNGTNFQLTGDIGSTGTRITKGWFIDLEVTNAILGGLKAANTSSGVLILNHDGVTVASFGVGSAASTNIAFSGNLALGTNNITMTGSLGTTGSRLTKGWFTDLEVTNAISGSVTGNAGTVTNATLTTALTVNTGTVTLTGNVANSSVLTIGAGAVSVSGANTGDQTITLTGDVTGAGTGSFATTIAAGAVDIAMLSATGTPSGTTYLRGDNTWATVSGFSWGATATGTSGDGVTLTSGSGAAANTTALKIDINNTTTLDTFGTQINVGTSYNTIGLQVKGNMGTSGARLWHNITANTDQTALDIGTGVAFGRRFNLKANGTIEQTPLISDGTVTGATLYQMTIGASRSTGAIALNLAMNNTQANANTAQAISLGTSGNTQGLIVYGTGNTTVGDIGTGKTHLTLWGNTAANANKVLSVANGTSYTENLHIKADGTITTLSTIELGHASDTTIARVSAGVISVEGVRVITSAGTTSGTILKNNGTTFVASTETYAAPGTSGNVMTSDGTNWTSAAPASSGDVFAQTSKPTTYWTTQIPITSTTSGLDGILSTWSRGNLDTTQSYTNGHFGSMLSNNVDNFLGGIAISLEPSGTGDSTFNAKRFSDTKKLVISFMYKKGASGNACWGLYDNGSGALYDPTRTTNSIMFTFDGTNLNAKTSDDTNQKESADITGITTTNWNLYRIEWNPGTNALFYINGTLQATITGTLPSNTDVIYFGCGSSANGVRYGLSSPIVSVEL